MAVKKPIVSYTDKHDEMLPTDTLDPTSLPITMSVWKITNAMAKSCWRRWMLTRRSILKFTRVSY
jgi:hypothetical protein